jgi:cytosine deaminase
MQAKTAFDLVFRNAVTRGAATSVDIGVSAGKIAAIAPKLVCEAAEVDVASRLVRRSRRSPR